MIKEKIIFLFDLKKILLGELINFFKSFNLKNPNRKKLFKLENKKKEKNLLIVSLSNVNFTINIESLFAKYFNLKNYNVYFLSNLKEQRAVKTFRAIGSKVIFHHFVYFKNGLKFLFKNLPEVKDSEELKNFSYQNIHIGIGIYSTVFRKLKIGQLDFSDKKTKRLARRYLWRSIVYLETAKEIINKIKPDLILALEKGYIGHSEIFNLATEKNIDFIQWRGCQEPSALIFKRYNKKNKREQSFSVSYKIWKEFLEKPWDENYEKEVYDIFERGYRGKDWFRYNNLMENTKLIGKEEFIKKYNLDSNKKIAVLFSHIMWDANLFYGKDLFGNGFEEWLIESVKVMVKNKNLNWLIKIHPANKYKHKLENIKGEYREIKALKENFGRIPENIKIIYPENNINPYSLFDIINYAITVRGTIGMEFPCFGVSTLIAGTGRYSGRGFTVDSQSRKEYLKLLSHLEDIPSLKESQRRVAILHAYIVFRLRPLRFQSYREKYLDGKMDIDIMIKKPEEGRDFIKFVNWATKSKEEDFLNQD